MGTASYDNTGELHLAQALYEENFAIASVFQYFTIWCFVKLCLTFLRPPHDEEEAQWQDAFGKLGFQGTYFFIILGGFRGILAFVFGFMNAHPKLLGLYPPGIGDISELRTLIPTKVDTIFSIVTLMCVYN